MTYNTYHMFRFLCTHVSLIIDHRNFNQFSMHTINTFLCLLPLSPYSTRNQRLCTLSLHWVPYTRKKYPNKMKCTCPMQIQTRGETNAAIFHHLDWICEGFALCPRGFSDTNLLVLAARNPCLDQCVGGLDQPVWDLDQCEASTRMGSSSDGKHVLDILVISIFQNR